MTGVQRGPWSSEKPLENVVGLPDFHLVVPVCGILVVLAVMSGMSALALKVGAGWLATGWIGADEFNPIPVTSLTFISPIADTVQYVMFSTVNESAIF